MKKNILACLISFFLLPVALVAQSTVEVKPGKPNELDRQYTPGKNSPLTGGSSLSSGGGAVYDYKNVAKMNFAMFARSTFAVFYERKITEDFSLQGGLGYCYNMDKAQYLLSEGEDFSLSSNIKSSLSLAKIVTNASYRQGANPFLAASVRFRFSGFYSYYYSNSDANNYIDIGIRYSGQHYNLSTLKNTSYEAMASPSKVSVRNTYYTLIYGYQLEAGSKMVTTHEFYWGGGLRKSTYDVFQVSAQSNNGSMQLHSKTGAREKVFTPVIVIGYVLGFAF